MKKALKSRSKSPSKRVRFHAAKREVTVPVPVSLSGYVRHVRRALKGRPDDYREFVDVMSDLQRSSAAVDDDSAIIWRIERAVSLLDGHPQLIAALRMYLPPHYHIDIQSDAVVVKVLETRGSCHVVDTGHCRPVGATAVQLTSPETTQHPSGTLRQRTASRRSGPGPPGRCPSVTPSVDTGEVGSTMSYVLEVKRALAAEPDVYRQFVDIVRRYHDQRRDDSANQLDPHAIRQIVALLRTRPQLVLNFNELLPDGYWIRMFDRSEYVIEYPDAVSGIARLTVAI